jgi:hypothetical protein
MANKYPPLYCHHCQRDSTLQADRYKIKATGATQFRYPKDKKRLCHELICSHGWKWWSFHKAAAALDRAADYQQQVETGRVTEA